MKRAIQQLIATLFCSMLIPTAADAQLQSAPQASPPSKQVSILFAGDMVLADLPGKAIELGQDPYLATKDILGSADLRIGNLECVIATSGKPADKNYTFRAHPRVIPVLQRYFDAVSLANNHSGDFGPVAFAEMLSLLKSQKLAYFGGGHNLSEAHQALIIEKNGLKIALLGYDEFMPRSFEANTNKAGVAWSEDEQVIADIIKARQFHKADIVIPFMHWGWENEMTANKRQRELAHKMIDAGADAIIGGHPHVIQDTEIYKGKPIIYSIGNFMMDALDNDAQTKGWVVRLHLDQHGVQAWDTRMININPEGIPAPMPDASSPCWNKKNGKIQECKNADLK